MSEIAKIARVAWREVTKKSIQDGDGVRWITLDSLKPYWDALALAGEGVALSGQGGWVIEAPGNKYVWKDPELRIMLPSCTNPARAMRFEENEAHEVAKKLFGNNYRKRMVVPVSSLKL